MEKCTVLIWDKEIGELYYADNKLIFRYTNIPPFEISPLMLSTETQSFDYNHLANQKHMAGAFADSLPDHYGQKALDKYFRSIGSTPNEIDKLLLIGDKTMGAITYQPVTDDLQGINQLLQVKELHEQVKKIISNDQLVDSSLGVQILKSVSPVGGAKPKALIGFKDIDSNIYIGERNGKMPKGYFPSIIKLATDEDGATANHLKTEYVYMKLAEKCGVAIPDIFLTADFHYVIKRFDREKSKEGFIKYHLHTLQGILHSDFSVPRTVDYVDAFRVMIRLNCEHESFTQLFKRMVFNFLFRNHDDHEKNISFLMNRSGEWRLSPAYDLTYNYKPNGRYIGDHQLTFNGKEGNSITDKDIKAIAKDFSIKEPQKIINTVKKVRHNLEEELSKLKVSADFIQEILSGVFDRDL